MCVHFMLSHFWEKVGLCVGLDCPFKDIFTA